MNGGVNVYARIHYVYFTVRVPCVRCVVVSGMGFYVTRFLVCNESFAFVYLSSMKTLSTRREHEGGAQNHTTHTLTSLYFCGKNSDLLC